MYVCTPHAAGRGQKGAPDPVEVELQPVVSPGSSARSTLLLTTLVSPAPRDIFLKLTMEEDVKSFLKNQRK